MVTLSLVIISQDSLGGHPIPGYHLTQDSLKWSPYHWLSSHRIVSVVTLSLVIISHRIVSSGHPILGYHHTGESRWSPYPWLSSLTG